MEPPSFVIIEVMLKCIGHPISQPWQKLVFSKTLIEKITIPKLLKMAFWEVLVIQIQNSFCEIISHWPNSEDQISPTDNNQFLLWSQSSPSPCQAGNFGPLTPRSHRNSHLTSAPENSGNCCEMLSLRWTMQRPALARWKTVLLLWLQNGLRNFECQWHVRILCTG